MSQMAPSSPPPQPDSPQPELPQSPAAPPGSKMGVLPVPGFLKGKTKMMAIVLAISGIVSVVGSALWLWHVIKPPQVGYEGQEWGISHDPYTNVHISAIDFKMMCAFTVVISWLSTMYAAAGMLLKERWVYRTYVFLALFQVILMLVLMFAFMFVAAAANGALGQKTIRVVSAYSGNGRGPRSMSTRERRPDGADYEFVDTCKDLKDYEKQFLDDLHLKRQFPCCFENPTDHVYCYSSTQAKIIKHYQYLYDAHECQQVDYYDSEHNSYNQAGYDECEKNYQNDLTERYRKLALGSGIFMVLFSFFSVVCKLLTAFLASVVARSLGPTALVATNSVSYPS